MDLSIIILNWNTRDLLRQCLTSILSDSCNTIQYEIIVVDNASSDGSRDMLKAEFPTIHLIVSKSNVGFGAGNNSALPEAKGRYILFLNTDTVVHPGALSSLIAYADSRHDLGVVGAKLINADGSLQYSCRHFPNLATGFFRNTPLGRLFPSNKFNADYLMSSWDHAEPRDVDWVSGAALLLRASLIPKVAGFDEDYYMYCEDVDLCWRVGQTVRDVEKGDTWKVGYYPHAVITHYIGKSSDKAPTRMTYEFHRSQYLFYRKHFKSKTPILLRPFILPGIMLRAVGQMTRYRVRNLQRRLGIGAGTRRNKRR